MASQLDAELESYGGSALTVRLCSVLFPVLPGAPAFLLYPSVSAAIDALDPRAPPAVRDRAIALSRTPPVMSALYMSRSIDAGVTGLLSVLTGSRDQEADAAVKVLAIAYLVHHLLPGPVQTRVPALRSIGAGRALLAWFGGVDVALPLVGTTGRGGVVSALYARQAKAAVDQIASFVGARSVAASKELATALLPALDRTAAVAALQVEAIAGHVGNVVPGGIASGADVLPVYRFLGARLAAEACLYRARLELTPDVAPRPPDAIDPDELPTDAGPNPFATPWTGPPPAVAESTPADGDRLLDAMRQEIEADAADEEAALRQLEDDVDVPDMTLDGVFVHDAVEGAFWFVFAEDGTFSDHPPADMPPDWDDHRAAGHSVGTYIRDDATLYLEIPGARAVGRATIAVGPYALVLDGRLCPRVDFDLRGRTLQGHYCPESGFGPDYSFDSDGTFASGAGSGRYALDIGSITLVHADGHEVRHGFLSTLEPFATQPAAVWIGGARYLLTPPGA